MRNAALLLCALGLTACAEAPVNKALREYEIVAEARGGVEACKAAQIVRDEYLRAEDAPKYDEWWIRSAVICNDNYLSYE